MSRLFTFGCSFTQYNWITWADIIGKLFDHYENNGANGAGNFYIFNSLLHNIVENNINSNDTVMIMWTNVTREDRFINGAWTCAGNIFTQNVFDENFVKKYVDIRGCYERDIPLIHAAKLILDGIGCNYHFMSMVDIDNSDQYTKQEIKNEDVSHLFQKFKLTLDIFKPSVHKVIYNYDYNSRPIPGLKKRDRVDKHPLPLEHLEYINKVLPEYTINDEIKQYVERNQEETLLYLQKLYGNI